MFVYNAQDLPRIIYFFKKNHSLPQIKHKAYALQLIAIRAMIMFILIIIPSPKKKNALYLKSHHTLPYWNGRGNCKFNFIFVNVPQAFDIVQSNDNNILLPSFFCEIILYAISLTLIRFNIGIF